MAFKSRCLPSFFNIHLPVYLPKAAMLQDVEKHLPESNSALVDTNMDVTMTDLDYPYAPASVAVERNGEGMETLARAQAVLSDDKPPPYTEREHISRTNHDFGFKILHDPKNAELDIIAIHGLDGHREGSWTSPNGVLWLRDLLPLRFPSARIITYGYNAAMKASDDQISQEVLYDHANTLTVKLVQFHEKHETERRPMIFIAHSVGGIILKFALLNAHIATQKHLLQRRALKNSTYGIIFLGTPHHGAEERGLLRTLRDIHSASLHESAASGSKMGSNGFRASKNMIQDIERDCRHMQKQLSDYAAISSDFDTKFIYETLSTFVPRHGYLMLVSKATAIVHGAVNAEALGFQCDHFQLIQFTSDDDDDYRMLVGFLRRMGREASRKVADVWRNVDAGDRCHITTSP